MADIYTSAVFEESGQRGIILPGNIRQDLYQTLRKTTAPRTSTTVDRITVWLATAVLSLATMKASEVDEAELFVEWVTMHDNDVRETHRDADGQVRPLGEKFDVGGAQMRYPGDPRVDPALWMNCRCTLRPVLAEEALVAASLAERPGLGGYPINNCADLKNAIQAIGRARPQDRAKTIAHIRTQKKNLGCPEVMLPESWATASEDAVKQKSAVVVALPHPDDPVHQIGDEQKHATVAFLGKGLDDPQVDKVRGAVSSYARDVGKPFEAKVSGQGTLGRRRRQRAVRRAPRAAAGPRRHGRPPRRAHRERRAPALRAARDHPLRLHRLAEGGVHQVRPARRVARRPAGRVPARRRDAPHQEEARGHRPRGRARPGRSRRRHARTCRRTPPRRRRSPPTIFPVETPTARCRGTPCSHPRTSGPATSASSPRGHSTNRPLPLPLTWQKTSAEGHDGNVTVAKTERIGKVKHPKTGYYEQRAAGHFIMNPEADEVVGPDRGVRQVRPLRRRRRHHL